MAFLIEKILKIQTWKVSARTCFLVKSQSAKREIKMGNRGERERHTCREEEGTEIDGDMRRQPARGKVLPGARTVVQVRGPLGGIVQGDGAENRQTIYLFIYFFPRPTSAQINLYSHLN